jgi:hypothetical protein
MTAIGLVLCASGPACAEMVFNTNLILNPGAELGAGALYNNLTVPVPDWTGIGGFTAVQYRTPPCNLPCLPGLPEADDPGPPNRGVNLFAGGSNDFEKTSGYQLVDVSNMASIIDAYAVSFNLNGWFGGYLNQHDNVDLSAIFLTGSGHLIGSTTVGPVLLSDRVNASGNYYTGLLYRGTSGVIPTGTRQIDFQLTMHGIDGSQNDGYADNLSFSANDPRVAIPEPGSLGTVLLGLAAAGLLLKKERGLKPLAG